MIWIGLGPYLLNCAVGLAAQLGGRRLGIWHHVLYALVVVSTVLTAILAFAPGMVVTIAALVAFPRVKPGSWRHPALAVLGLCGYGLAWAWN